MMVEIPEKVKEMIERIRAFNPDAADGAHDAVRGYMVDNPKATGEEVTAMFGVLLGAGFAISIWLRLRARK